MRAMWKGSVSFGLVNVPVSMYTATKGHDVSFHQVHKADGGRIRYRRVCEVDEKQVEYADIAKGLEVGGQLVVLTDEDLEQLPLSSSKEIEIAEFVDTDEIDPLLLDKSYYLEPERRAIKQYVLLREALARTDRVAIVKVALRQRESLALLRVRDNVIVLQTMLWPDEVRKADFDVLDADVNLRKQEMQMADSLVESLTATFEPSDYEDGYAAAVEALVESKLTGGQTLEPPEGGGDKREDAEVVDLMAALRRSIDSAKQKSGGSAGDRPSTGTPAKKAPAKKAAAKKTPAKKTAAAKTPAKKAPAKAAAKKAPARKSTTKKAATRKSA